MIAFAKISKIIKTKTFDAGLAFQMNFVLIGSPLYAPGNIGKSVKSFIGIFLEIMHLDDVMMSVDQSKCRI